MTKDEALKEAIYLIEAFGRGCDCDDYSMDISKTIDALKEALHPESQPESQPTDQYMTITKSSYFAMENQIHTIRQEAIKECANLVMDWEMVDLNITAGQRIMEKLYVQPESTVNKSLTVKKPLSDEEIIDIKFKEGLGNWYNFARAIEKHHGIGSDLSHIGSVDSGIGIAVKKPIQQYTGEAMIGIGQLHKSNAIPVFSQEDAIDISKMRRG